LVPVALLLWSAIRCAEISRWLALLPLPLIILFIVRAFGLMHECSHGSLFRSRWLNRKIGFVLGVLSGMPQYVWSQHHNYHHAHHGNWDKYRGPYTTLSVDEYAVLSRARQRFYRCKCSVAAVPLAGFIYLIFNPRFTWSKGSIGLLIHAVRQKLAQPHISFRTHVTSYRSRYWKSAREYRHILWNNIVLLSGCALMCWACARLRGLPNHACATAAMHDFYYVADEQRRDSGALAAHARLVGHELTLAPRGLGFRRQVGPAATGRSGSSSPDCFGRRQRA